MPSKMRDISKFLARTAIANVGGTERIKFQGETGNLIDSSKTNTIINSLATSYELTQDSLAVTGLTAGDMTLVESAYDGTRLYLSNGLGWYNVALVNITPTFDSDLNDSATIVDSNTSLVITNPATDSDNIITYSGTASDSAQYMVTITNDSSVWTFDPLSADSVHSNVTAGNIPDSAGGTFTYTFQATDGINTATKEISITYNLPTGLITGLWQGTSYGYRSGGQPGSSDVIDKWSFASAASASDVGDLTEARSRTSGASSPTHGYTAGGFNSPPTPNFSDVIDRFSFSSDGNASDVGNLALTRGDVAGQSSTSYGYVSGGFAPGVPLTNQVDRYPFAASANASDIADLSVARTGAMGQQSSTHAYTSGGATPPTTHVIDKFPFASHGTATDVGDLTQHRSRAAGMSSGTHGYTANGYKNPAPSPGAYLGTLDKFPFASDANAASAGNMLWNKYGVAGNQSTTHGHVFGGEKAPWPPVTNHIHAVAFASDAVSTWGSLTAPASYSAGQNY